MSDQVRKGVKRNYFTSYNMIFDLSIDIYAKMVYQYLCRCSDSSSQSFPSLATIAEKCSCGTTSVKNAINTLIKLKLVVKKNRFRKTRNNKFAQTSNLYIVYDRPFDTIPQNELEDISDEFEEIIVDTPSRDTTPINPCHNASTPLSQDDSTPSRGTTTPLSQDDYKGITNLRTTQKEGLSIYQSNENLEMMDGLNDIFKNCEIEIYNDSVKSIIKNSIIDMYCCDDFSNKTGIPKIIVQERLKSMCLYTIDRALESYKSAVSSGIEITAPLKYFQKCLWSAMIDNKLDLFGLS